MFGYSVYVYCLLYYAIHYSDFNQWLADFFYIVEFSLRWPFWFYTSIKGTVEHSVFQSWKCLFFIFVWFDFGLAFSICQLEVFYYNPWAIDCTPCVFCVTSSQFIPKQFLPKNIIKVISRCGFKTLKLKTGQYNITQPKKRNLWFTFSVLVCSEHVPIFGSFT